MRIGVYVDGFNVYYGARGLCGRGTPGWRWLDLRSLATDLIGKRADWPSARVERLVYWARTSMSRRIFCWMCSAARRMALS
jgi:hypothetical protein